MTSRSIFSQLPTKIGLASLAILCCLAERGVVLISEMMASRHKPLRRSLQEINSLKDVDDYYQILKNLHENSARTILWRLQKRGLVKKGESGFSLTNLGTMVIKKFNHKPEHKQEWDGKWRMVLFDIPESRKAAREWIRASLLRQNYYALQKSVFISKNPIQEEFAAALVEKNLYRFVRIITIGEIDDETFLRDA